MEQTTKKITFLPGIHIITAPISMAEFSGQMIIDPAFGTLNEQLKRRHEAAGNSSRGYPFRQNN